MNKFVKLSVINREWCMSMATVNNIHYRKFTGFKHVCAICGVHTRNKLHVYEEIGMYGFVTTHYFCNDCVVCRAERANRLISLKRVIADYINHVVKKDIFMAKRIAFRKSDIFTVEGAAYDHSILYFNTGTAYAGHDSVRVTERKNIVMKLLGETIVPIRQ